MERMTMSNLQTPFRYDFVGSFLRPEKLKKARRQFNEGKIDAAALKKVEDEAITELVSKIKELGTPAPSTALISSPSFQKSAERIEGDK